VPPLSGGSAGDGAVYLDGKKVGDIIGAQIANAMSGPTQGSAFVVHSRLGMTTDTTLSYG
jgi:hypothetical protein